MASEEPILASVAGRYASALFDLANEQGQLSELEADVVALQGMLDESEDLRRLVRSPLISSDDQVKALDAVLGKAGAGTLLTNFMKLVARNRRLFATQDMLKSFRAIAARHRGEVTAEVTTATALTQPQLDQLEDVLRIEVGKEVKVQTRVDPAILGGLIVKVGSRMVDSSLRTKLSSLKTRMKEVS